MSHLHPGGQRTAWGTRIFGAENIRRHIRSKPRNYGRRAEASIAKLNRHTGSPHEHKREIARRSRQAARRAGK